MKIISKPLRFEVEFYCLSGKQPAECLPLKYSGKDLWLHTSLASYRFHYLLRCYFPNPNLLKILSNFQIQTAICFKLTKQWLSRVFSNIKSRLSYSAKTKLYDVRTISGDWPQSVFGITWVYALTYIRNLLDDYMTQKTFRIVRTISTNHVHKSFVKVAILFHTGKFQKYRDFEG